MAQQKRSAASPTGGKKKPAARSEPARVTVTIGEKLLLSVEEFAALTGLSRREVFRRIAGPCPEIPSGKIGRLRKIPRAAAEAYVHRVVTAA